MPEVEPIASDTEFTQIDELKKLSDADLERV